MSSGIMMPYPLTVLPIGLATVPLRPFLGKVILLRYIRVVNMSIAYCLIEDGGVKLGHGQEPYLE
ncbi:hypothetical protein ES703_110696 [subsurface metagenome]